MGHVFSSSSHIPRGTSPFGSRSYPSRIPSVPSLFCALSRGILAIALSWNSRGPDARRALGKSRVQHLLALTSAAVTRRRDIISFDVLLYSLGAPFGVLVYLMLLPCHSRLSSEYKTELSEDMFCDRLLSSRVYCVRHPIHS